MRHFFMSYSVAFVVAIVVLKCDLCIVVLGDTFLVVSMFSFLFVVFWVFKVSIIFTQAS